MKLKKIEFTTPPGQDEVMPDKITLELGIEEVAYLARIVERITHGGGLNSGIFSCLHGDVINRYWEEGSSDKRLPPTPRPREKVEMV